MTERTIAGPMELRHGRWQDVLADVPACAAVITDPPYSAETHNGHNNANHVRDKLRPRASIDYAPFTGEQCNELVASFRPANWFACLCDSGLIQSYKDAYSKAGLKTFAPVPCVTNGMTVRLAGDGPSSWTVYLMVARTKAAAKWGTLDGAYTNLPQGERLMAGSKSLVLMRAIIRDYTRPGDLILDPYAGTGTTLLAAAMEGRRAIGAEMDAGRYALASRRIRKGYTPDFFSAA